jgi:hypothetical protein
MNRKILENKKKTEKVNAVNETITDLPKPKSSAKDTNYSKNASRVEAANAIKLPALAVKNPAEQTAIKQEIPNNSFSTDNSSTNEYYSLDYKYTGFAIMINNYKFTNESFNFPEGVSDKDIASFKTLDNFNFITNSYLNQTKDQIVKLIDYYTSHDYDYTDYACVFVCMSSHGAKDTILSSDCTSMEITEDIIEPFYKVESLKNKPKIFLFDCCRGDLEIKKTAVVDDDGDDDDGNNNNDDEANNVVGKTNANKRKRYKIKLAELSNFFMAYSTSRNFIAGAHSEKGSYFMSAFFEILAKHGRTDDWNDLVIKLGNFMKTNYGQVPVFEGSPLCKFAFVKLENKNKDSMQHVEKQLQKQFQEFQQQHLQKLELQQKQQFQQQTEFQQQMQLMLQQHLKPTELIV